MEKCIYLIPKSPKSPPTCLVQFCTGAFIMGPHDTMIHDASLRLMHCTVRQIQSYHCESSAGLSRCVCVWVWGGSLRSPPHRLRYDPKLSRIRLQGLYSRQMLEVTGSLLGMSSSFHKICCESRRLACCSESGATDSPCCCIVLVLHSPFQGGFGWARQAADTFVFASWSCRGMRLPKGLPKGDPIVVGLPHGRPFLLKLL